MSAAPGAAPGKRDGGFDRPAGGNDFEDGGVLGELAERSHEPVSSSARGSTCSRAIGASASRARKPRTVSSSRTTWDEYADWHLGLTDGATEETKARYAFVYGDFRRVHRSGLIAAQYRAAEWRHKKIELAAHTLLQLLDETAA